MTFSCSKLSVPVLIVRHAPSTWNAEGRWQGRADPPLSAAGQQMAIDAAARVGQVDLVITSGLIRAIATGELLVPGAEAVEVEGLGEYDIGEWSGLTRSQITQRWPDEMAAFEAGELDVPPGGESRLAFDQRVEVATRLVVKLIETYEPGSVLIVTHAGVVRAICRLLGAEDRHVGHLCGFEGAVKEGGLALVAPVCLLDPEAADEARVDPQAL